jgi:hypothetical protein
MTGTIDGAVAEIMAARYRPERGDRVRVLRSECRYCYEMPDGSDSSLSLAYVGRTGTVVAVGHDHHDCIAWQCGDESDGAAQFHAHNIWGEFDDPPVSRYGPEEVSHFAPTELEAVQS